MMSEVNTTGDAFPLRSAKARITRRSIIDAAAALFLEHGYLATSVQHVADAAGVSRATVFNSVGGKLQLLRGAYDVATVGDDEPVPLPRRPEAIAVIEEPDQVRAIALYAAMVTGVSTRLSQIYELFRSVAGVDPDVRAEWADIQRERLGGARGFVRLLRAKGPLREGLSDETAGDVVWTLIDASLYHRLVIERGWSVRRFRTWLAHAMERELLD
jgi:AcrR family transcriptional regulator